MSTSENRLPATFEKLFGRPPMASAAAPGRINLLGEYTDLVQGWVLPTATLRRTCIEIALSGDDFFRYYSANLRELVTHPEGDGVPPGFARYVHGCVQVLRRRGCVIAPVLLRIDSDLPIGAGLSSSASLSVAALRSLRALFSLDIDDLAIARLAQEAEADYAGVRTGLLDQLACSYCAPQQMLLLDTRTLERRALALPAGTELVVLHSGIERELASTAYNQRRGECEAAARELRVGSLREITDVAQLAALPSVLQRRARHIVTENRRVQDAVHADGQGFGALMNASHASLRDDFEVSVPALDTLVEALQGQPDVLGARLTGAGFGGACVALVRRGSARRVSEEALAIHAQAGHAGRVLV